MSAVSKKNNPYFLLITWAFFLFMMLNNITHSPLWGDEWVEYDTSQMGILNLEIFRGIVSTFQPPLYNLLMHFWLLVNNSVLWFRLFNVLIGLISGALLYKTLSVTTSVHVAMLALVVLGTSYQWIYCIQECSEYALMLAFLFAALYFFVLLNKEYSLKREVLLILSCVLAIYSQYGAAFVAGPILMVYLFNVLKNSSSQNKKRTLLAYAISFIVFALPLYFLFLRFQLGNTVVDNRLSFIKDLLNAPFVFGKLIAYFFNVDGGAVSAVLVVLGIVFLVICVFLLFRKKTDSDFKSLVIVLLSSYISFFVLVTFRVYAMVHYNQSSGYYSRYSYFFIPLFFVLIPILTFKLAHIVRFNRAKQALLATVLFVTVIVSAVSFPKVLANWEKSYDDVFASIWMNNHGFDEITYLFGDSCKNGFDYYTNNYNYQGSGRVLVVGDEIDMDHLPQSFWAWRSNWAGNGWQEIIDHARESGYHIVVFCNKDGMVQPQANKYQLAYCYLENGGSDG